MLIPPLGTASWNPHPDTIRSLHGHSAFPLRGVEVRLMTAEVSPRRLTWYLKLPRAFWNSHDSHYVISMQATRHAPVSLSTSLSLYYHLDTIVQVLPSSMACLQQDCPFTQTEPSPIFGLPLAPTWGWIGPIQDQTQGMFQSEDESSHLEERLLADQGNPWTFLCS